jgi:hypothetical protein
VEFFYTTTPHNHTNQHHNTHTHSVLFDVHHKTRTSTYFRVIVSTAIEYLKIPAPLEQNEDPIQQNTPRENDQFLRILAASTDRVANTISSILLTEEGTTCQLEDEVLLWQPIEHFKCYILPKKSSRNAQEIWLSSELIQPN